MTENEMLNQVKKGLGISGTFHDDTLSIYINSVKQFMISAGVAEGVANDGLALGAILAGVNDLWNYSSGNAKFSEFFIQRMLQLKTVKPPDTNGDGGQQGGGA